MPRFQRKKSSQKLSRFVGLCGGATVLALTGCSPSTMTPIGMTNQSSQTVSFAGKSFSSWSALKDSVSLGLKSRQYQEKVAVNVSHGILVGGFTVYGRVNPPDKVSVAFHQNGYNPSFYQQGLSAYGQITGHWQQSPAVSDLNVFPSYAQFVGAMTAHHVPVYKLQPAQYVVDEYCDVYQATVPAKLVSALPDWASTYYPTNMSDIVYTFYIGQKDGELRQVTTSSDAAISGVGSVQIQSDTILFAINQIGSKITIDPNLYNSLLYQY